MHRGGRNSLEAIGASGQQICARQA